LEHVNEKQQMKAGQVERIDPEYERHGTSGIIASRNVVTGEIVAPLTRLPDGQVQRTRTELDFLFHIESVVEANPFDKHIFLVDQLNTHKSESLLRFVADKEGIDLSTLGVKDKSGILKNMESRSAFLADKEHQIVFVYTPKHCSWLNQIEVWFSIITRRLLNRRASFMSVEELEQKIWNFIVYYNQFLKKPFKWKFDGHFRKSA
jgi:transposase